MPKPRPKTKAPPAAKPMRSDWDRDQVTLRLTPDRKAGLLRVAETMPQGASPGQAIDRGIERALASDARDVSDALLDRLDALEHSTELSAASLRSGLAAVAALCRQALEATHAMARLMSDIAGVDIGTLPSGHGEGGVSDRHDLPTQSMRSWLEAKARGRESIAVIGRRALGGQATARSGAVELEIALADEPSDRHDVRMPSLPATHPLALVEFGAPLRLDCKRDEAGEWLARVRRLSPDRTPCEILCDLAL